MSGRGSVFSAPTRSGWHRHHLIPHEVQRYPDLARFVVNLPLPLGDFDMNGMFLPALESIAHMQRLPLHREPHRSYSDIVVAALSGICGPAPVDEVTRPRKLLLVRSLQGQLRSLLQTSAQGGEVVLGSRDPFGPSPNLMALDRRTEALFAKAMEGANHPSADWT